ncbi:MAG TPA: hypothetical protein VJA16_09775 [Thermoanaerobaculia bacterium]
MGVPTLRDESTSPSPESARLAQVDDRLRRLERLVSALAGALVAARVIDKGDYEDRLASSGP